MADNEIHPDVRPLLNDSQNLARQFAVEDAFREVLIDEFEIDEKFGKLNRFNINM